MVMVVNFRPMGILANRGLSPGAIDPYLDAQSPYVDDTIDDDSRSARIMGRGTLTLRDDILRPSKGFFLNSISEDVFQRDNARPHEDFYVMFRLFYDKSAPQTCHLGIIYGTS
ncbi:hypothetical protein TNCV_3391271 [Trichonephila clavipes]|nr:hypothetical protein TNCV_3391271 [Trichonephila clavipes]